MRKHANPFDDASVASHYQDWYASAGRRADRLEKALFSRLLTDFEDARSVLDIGCGTGHFTRWLEERGLQVTGLDASPAMLAEARRHGTAGCVLGSALALPFAVRAFDLAFLITTLEFLSDPLHALTEAVRVARRGIIVGALNRHSLLGLRRRFFRDHVWQPARLLTVRKLLQLSLQRDHQRQHRVHHQGGACLPAAMAAECARDRLGGGAAQCHVQLRPGHRGDLPHGWPRSFGPGGMNR